MNKRQAKKAFKKKYGYNPPKNDYIAEFNNIDFAAVGEALAAGLKAGLERACEVLQEMARKVGAFLADFRERIQTMPEEEFNAWLESGELDDQQKALLKLIRERGK